MNTASARLVSLLAAGAVLAGLPARSALPPEVERARAEVIRIAEENTERTGTVPEVRQALEPHVAVLSEWFAANRPADEVALTQQPWKNLWYDDPDIDGALNFALGALSLYQDRTRIYQVVQDGYYYNVSELRLTLFGTPIYLQNFLKGAYTLEDGGPGDPRRNIVDLQFVANSIRLGRLPARFPLDPLVYLVELGWLPTIPIPGPIGVTGELWNLYVDQDLRVAAGFDDAEPGTLDLYILRRVERTDPR